jgi:hypothetical protein
MGSSSPSQTRTSTKHLTHVREDEKRFSSPKGELVERLLPSRRSVPKTSYVRGIEKWNLLNLGIWI